MPCSSSMRRHSGRVHWQVNPLSGRPEWVDPARAVEQESGRSGHGFRLYRAWWPERAVHRDLGPTAGGQPGRQRHDGSQLVCAESVGGGTDQAPHPHRHPRSPVRPQQPGVGARRLHRPQASSPSSSGEPGQGRVVDQGVDVRSGAVRRGPARPSTAPTPVRRWMRPCSCGRWRANSVDAEQVGTWRAAAGHRGAGASRSSGRRRRRHEEGSCPAEHALRRGQLRSA